MFEVVEEMTGMKIKAIRGYLGLTQAEFSKEIGDNLQRGENIGRAIEAIQISRWEKGYGLPSVQNLEAISKMTGLTMNEIINDDISPKKIEQLMFANGIEKEETCRKRAPRRKANDVVRISSDEIRELRQLLNMTQVEFAEYVQKKSMSVSKPSSSVVSAWENGRVVPNVDHEQGLLRIKEEVAA